MTNRTTSDLQYLDSVLYIWQMLQQPYRAFPLHVLPMWTNGTIIYPHLMYYGYHIQVTTQYSLPRNIHLSNIIYINQISISTSISTSFVGIIQKLPLDIFFHWRLQYQSALDRHVGPCLPTGYGLLNGHTRLTNRKTT